MASVFDFVRGNVPKVQTSKALILTGLQTDFCSPDGKLFAHVDSGFIHRLERLLAAFRPHGHVIWVRSEYDPTMPVEDQGADVYNVCLPPQQFRRHSQTCSTENGFGPDALISSQPTSDLHAVDEELFLDTAAKGGPATVKGTLGAQYAASIKHLIKPEDQHIVKHNYSAFHMTDLLMTLRCRLAMQVYICGALSNISAHATALDAASNGITITLIEDCMAYRHRDRHDLAIASLTRDSAARTLTLERFIDVLDHPDRALADEDDSVYDDDRYDDDELGTYGDEEEQLDALRYEPPEVTQSVDEMVYTSHCENGMVEKHIASDNSLVQPLSQTAPSSQSTTSADKLSQDQPSFHVSVDSLKRPLITEPLEPIPSHSEGEMPASITLPLRSLSKRCRTRYMGDAVPMRVQQRQCFATTCWTLPFQPSSAIPHNDTDWGYLLHHESASAEQLSPNSPQPPTSLLPDSSDSLACQDVEVQKAWDDSLQHDDQQIASVTGSDSVTVIQLEGDIPSFCNQMRKTSILPPAEPALTQTRSRKPLLGDGFEKESAGSSIVYDLLDQISSQSIFDDLKDEVQWVHMLHQTGEVPRLVCCQGTTNADGSTPVYRHPSDKTILVTPWTCRVDQVRRIAEEVVGHQLNHALIQLYRSGHDFISEHSDKTLDIVPGSNIVNVSFGAERTMRLRTKRGAGDDSNQIRTTHRIRMPHNSMLIMSLRTNAEYLHGIKADKRRAAELSADESAFEGQRISITFRRIGTYLTSDCTRIWGCGALAKHANQAGLLVSGGSPESKTLIDAFGRENQLSDIQWQSCYGSGSDVLHLTG